MKTFAVSSDGSPIHFESNGKGDIALVFVHGWLGNGTWWNHQRDAFSNHYQVVQIDLAGHGQSPAQRKIWSVKAYAEDIKAVVEKLDLKNVVLIGHSMSGSNIVEAYRMISDRVKMLVFVDTLHNLDQMPSMKEMAPLFDGMRKDYRATIEFSFPKFMFTKSSPQAVVERIVGEIAGSNPSLAISALEPFYTTEIRDTCKQIKIPVRAINTDLYPTSPEENGRYFSNFKCEIIPGFGHYPMLEAPEKFNETLNKVLTGIHG